MTTPPIIDMQIRDLGEQVIARLILRKDEINASIDEGVNRALAAAPDAIVDKAIAAAHDALDRAIEAYFENGAGYEAIRDSVKRAMAPLTMKFETPAPCPGPQAQDTKTEN